MFHIVSPKLEIWHFLERTESIVNVICSCIAYPAPSISWETRALQAMVNGYWNSSFINRNENETRADGSVQVKSTIRMAANYSSLGRQVSCICNSTHRDPKSKILQLLFPRILFPHISPIFSNCQ